MLVAAVLFFVVVVGGFVNVSSFIDRFRQLFNPIASHCIKFLEGTCSYAISYIIGEFLSV